MTKKEKVKQVCRLFTGETDDWSIRCVNQTQGYKYSSKIFTNMQFKDLQKMFGRCISKMYRDLPNKQCKTVGYVFLKKEKYEDCNEYFIQETWCERLFKE